MKFALLALSVFLSAAASAGDTIVGVGLTLRQADSSIVVEQLISGAPAQRDGTIRKGDQILAVKQLAKEGGWVSTERMSLDEIVQNIRGPLATPVSLHLKGAQGQYELTLNREAFLVP